MKRMGRDQCLLSAIAQPVPTVRKNMLLPKSWVIPNKTLGLMDINTYICSPRSIAALGMLSKLGIQPNAQ